MTLEADLERFPLAAAEWDGVADKVFGAANNLNTCQGSSWRFGPLAASVGDKHDQFIVDILAVLGDGGNVAGSIAETLREVARLFGMTDQEQAQYLRTTKDRI